MCSCPLFAAIDAVEHCIKDMMGEFSAIQYRKCCNDLPVTDLSLGYPMPNVSPVDNFLIHLLLILGKRMTPLYPYMFPLLSLAHLGTSLKMS